MISVVDNNIIWGMSGTTSGAYCQQWTTIRGVTCISDAVFVICIVVLRPSLVVVAAGRPGCTRHYDAPGCMVMVPVLPGTRNQSLYAS